MASLESELLNGSPLSQSGEDEAGKQRVPGTVPSGSSVGGACPLGPTGTFTLSEESSISGSYAEMESPVSDLPGSGNNSMGGVRSGADNRSGQVPSILRSPAALESEGIDFDTYVFLKLLIWKADSILDELLRESPYEFSQAINAWILSHDSDD